MLFCVLDTCITKPELCIAQYQSLIQVCHGLFRTCLVNRSDTCWYYIDTHCDTKNMIPISNCKCCPKNWKHGQPCIEASCNYMIHAWYNQIHVCISGADTETKREFYYIWYLPDTMNDSCIDSQGDLRALWSMFFFWYCADSVFWYIWKRKIKKIPKMKINFHVS